MSRVLPSEQLLERSRLSVKLVALGAASLLLSVPVSLLVLSKGAAPLLLSVLVSVVALGAASLPSSVPVSVSVSELPHHPNTLSPDTDLISHGGRSGSLSRIWGPSGGGPEQSQE